MFKFTDEEKTFKDIVKEEVFRQYLVGNLLSLDEQLQGDGEERKMKKTGRKLKYSDVASELEDDEDADTNLTADELINNYNAKPDDEKREMVSSANSLFISELSNNDEFVEFTLNKHIDNEELFFNLLLYAIGKKDELPAIKHNIYKFYLDFILDKFFKPTSTFIGTKSALTGNKKVDKAVKMVIFKYFSRLLRSKYSFPKHYRSLDNKITAYIKNNLQDVRGEINEGLLTSINLTRLMFSIGFLFDFNKKTNAQIKAVLSEMDPEDLKETSKGGKSNTATLITKAILKRIAEELVIIKIGADPNLDKLLALIGYDLIRENSDLNNALEDVLEKLIQNKLEDLKKPNTKLTNMLASFGGFAG